MSRDFRLVGDLARIAALRQWLDAGALDRGVEPRSAATVLVLRQAPDGVEVVTLKRAATMAFAPSMHAFPGGSVDERDSGVELADDIVQRAAVAMRVSAEVARRHLAAALREVTEETGIVLRPEDLRVRGRWLTPVFDRRRYDTWILAAMMPPGEMLQHLTSEAVSMQWSRPRDILDAFERDELVMLPPTMHALEQLASASSLEDYLAMPADPRVVMPRLFDEGGVLGLRVDL